MTLIQSATTWHDPVANRAHFDDWFRRLPTHQDLVVLPEMFSTGFTMASATVAEPMQGPTVAWMVERAVQFGWHLTGSVVIVEAEHYFNRLVWATPEGQVFTYDKRHLFRMAGEHAHYAAGQERLVVEVSGWRVCPFVCYDLRFPVWLRNQGDYDMLLCVANWPAARRDAWNTLLQARAIENQVYCAGVNVVGRDGNDVAYSGGTAVYAPDGTLIEGRFDTPAAVSADLDPTSLLALRESFPVWQDADEFSLTPRSNE